ncbi:hypothetical protein FNYG_07755 [Fusarium nygamai]|uniref:Uncharacterized protein n=1 Tax=Gibberella nygamai TaxID=42673 RepID=A0A2K0W9B3_GIBNY|nr:hypothetical protein FNYG_07755 [Fusarium nygamai]
MSPHEKQNVDHIEQDVTSQKEWSHVQGEQGASIDRNMSLWEAIKPTRVP